MSYNNRMSQQFRGTQQQQQHRGRKKEDENDAMMRLVRPLAPRSHVKIVSLMQPTA